MLNFNAMLNIAAVNRKSIEQPQNTAHTDAFSQEIKNASQRHATPKTASKQAKGEPELEEPSKKADEAETNKTAEEAALPLTCIPVIASDAADVQSTQSASQELPIQPVNTQSVTIPADTQMQTLQTEDVGQEEVSVKQRIMQSLGLPQMDLKAALVESQPAAPESAVPQSTTPQSATPQSDVPQSAIVQSVEQSNAQIEAPLTPQVDPQLTIAGQNAQTPAAVGQKDSGITASQGKAKLSVNTKGSLEQPQLSPDAPIEVQATEAPVEPQADSADTATLLAKDTAETTVPSENKNVGTDDDSTIAFQPGDSDGAMPIEIKVNVRSAAELQSPQVKEAVAEKIVQTIETLVQEEKNHVKIQMKPDVLGGMTIKLSLEHDGLKVQLLTTGKETHGIVNDQIVQLKDALRDRGITIQQMEVIDQSNSEGFAQPFARQEQQQQNRPKEMPIRNNPYKEDVAGVSSIYDSMVRTEGIPLGSVEFSA